MKRNYTLNLKKLKLEGKVQKRSSLHIAHIKYLLTQGNNLRFPQGLIREGHASNSLEEEAEGLGGLP